MNVWKDSSLARHWQRLTKRERRLVPVVAAIVLSALLYRYPYAAGEQANNLLKAQAADTEKAALDLASKIVELQGKASEIKAALAAVPGRELISDTSAVVLLDEVTGEARRTGVNILSVHPSRELDREHYREVSMNMDLKGRYRQLGEYFKRLERLVRIVNIRNVRMEACPDSASVCSVRVEAVAYMAK
ncbi:MAG: type 4a pilus biogenesis protein PilO [Nitrospirota bacterium]|nr:type 4a pilus biogenesis protein PilO [Nitrospirota bacterium]